MQLTGLNVLKLDSTSTFPYLDQDADILGVVVAANDDEMFALFRDLFH